MSVSPSMAALVRDVPVIPVIVVDRLEDAVPMAEALVAGGLSILEVTLRTPAALAAVEAVAAQVAGARVGVGSVIDPRQFADARNAGATFAVSPGATPQLDEAARVAGIEWLPGAQTPGEVLQLRALGHRFVKFFPAEAAGGVAWLKSVAGPIPDVRFCPTGGITAANARDYLSLPNVACVGGSWVIPAAAVRAGRWDEVEALARQARGLRDTGTATG
ncbi:MAG: bifunctional 4-hydroxy-2-oxoglutarate aldolase/2-dehydro-3-deoxy-phosphogluconate aldolase [Steroidobacteraceae bacterium]